MASPHAASPSPGPTAQAPPRDERSASPIPPRSPRGGREYRDRERERPARDGERKGRDGEDAPRRRGGADKYRPARKERTPPPVATEEQKQAAAKAEYEKLLTARSGGTYVPPARLRALQAAITDKTSAAYQRMAWDALKKSINGLINKVNVSNIKPLVPELFNENLMRGRGLFCQSAVKAQAASLPFTPIYAALVAVVNTKLPQVGDLLLRRLVLRFRKAFRRNDKAVCLSATAFVGHLVNQQVAHEMVAAQMLLLLLNKPTDDSVEIAVGLTREVGQFLEEMNPGISNVVFDRFRTILHEADITKRTQYMIEVLFQTRKDRFKDNPAVRDELDLVEEQDQVKHLVDLDGDLDPQDTLNIFKLDPDYEANEEKYKKLKAQILGEGSDYEDDDDDDDDDDSDDESEAEETKAVDIQDRSNADLVALRRTIYLTLMSSIDPEEAVHKLMKLNLPQGLEPELPSLVVESCAQERTYSKFYGAIGERLAKINRLWTGLFEKSFEHYYTTIHRYETNRLRNIARFFGHMFSTEAIGWHCFSAVRLTEQDTTSASRIFIKIMFQEMSEAMGMPKLQTRMRDEQLQPYLAGIFPRDSAQNVRFSINYFTSIGMGALTEEMREYLVNIPKPALPAVQAADDSDSDSDSRSSYSSYTGSSYSSRSRSRSRTPARAAAPAARQRPRSYSRSRSRSLSRSLSPYSRRQQQAQQSRRRSPSRTRSPSRSRGGQPAPVRRDRSYSRSRSPPNQAQRGRSYTRSLSPVPPAQRDRSYSSRRRSPAPRQAQRGRSYTRSRSPAPARRDRSYSRGRSLSASRSPSRSPSRSRSRTQSPPRRSAAGQGQQQQQQRPSDGGRDHSRSRSRSIGRDPRAPGARRSRTRTRSLSPSPAPSRRRRRDGSSDRSSDAPRKRRRNS